MPARAVEWCDPKGVPMPNDDRTEDRTEDRAEDRRADGRAGTAADRAVDRIAMTDFALRNWQPAASGTLVEGITPDDLAARCNRALAGAAALVDGYAPFCKHLFLANDTPTRAGFAPITAANAGALRSGYRARREGEMAVGHSAQFAPVRLDGKAAPGEILPVRATGREGEALLGAPVVETSTEGVISAALQNCHSPT